MITDLLIGGIGGIVSRSAVAPVELTRLQMQNRFIPNSTLKDVYTKEGIRYFWKGNGTNCVRVFPQLSINYAVFRKTKKHAEKLHILPSFHRCQENRLRLHSRMRLKCSVGNPCRKSMIFFDVRMQTQTCSTGL